MLVLIPMPGVPMAALHCLGLQVWVTAVWSLPSWKAGILTSTFRYYKKVHAFPHNYCLGHIVQVSLWSKGESFDCSCTITLTRTLKGRLPCIMLLFVSSGAPLASSSRLELTQVLSTTPSSLHCTILLDLDSWRKYF